MHTPNPESDCLPANLAQYPLLTALRERRSRRFASGMKIPGGPLAFESRHRPTPLKEDEEAALVFAACGITGHALADLCYAPGEGGNIMGGLVARTISSGDFSARANCRRPKSRTSSSWVGAARLPSCIGALA